jgi:hypothetical protein
MAFQVPYIYDYTTILCRQQAKITRIHENANFHDIGKTETRPTKYKTLTLGDGQAYYRASD